MTGRRIQANIALRLREIFATGFVHTEWSVKKNARDTFRDAATYAPRLDIAVGPFNLTTQHRDRDGARIRAFDHALMPELWKFVRQQNDGDSYENPNPRCLLAIEVEHRTSSKHVLGGITNASMLGLVGVVIGSPGQIGKIRRIHSYARKLKEVGKAAPELFGNVACCSEQEFLDLLESYRIP